MRIRRKLDQNSSPQTSPTMQFDTTQQRVEVWRQVTMVANFWITTRGSLSNDDGDGNENGKKKQWVGYFNEV